MLEGTEADVTARLVKQYTGSLVAGRNPLLITDANSGAEKLAALVRAQLIELGEVDGDGETAAAERRQRGEPRRPRPGAEERQDASTREARSSPTATCSASTAWTSVRQWPAG